MVGIEWQNADIKMNVSANSVQDSNLFLRKFYDELSKKMKIGWNYQPSRTGKLIYVGMSGFGSMWLDYKVKGKINNIYISTPNAEVHNIVEDALKEAIVNHNSLEIYNIKVDFLTDDISFVLMCRKNIKVKSFYSKEKGQNITSISFSLRAFGCFDLQYVATQKINYLKYLLCVYTNFQFDMIRNYKILDDIQYDENSWSNYDLHWVDYVFDGASPEAVELIPDFFDVFRVVLDNDSYEKTMRLLLNSAQELYCGQIMLNDSLQDSKYNIPGYADMIDTILISALEPLSVIGAEKPETCPECGNLKYKIRKKVEDLCAKYVNEGLTKEISNIGYGKRSSFLHEGHAKTNEFYCGRCMPLIDPETPNMMLNAAVSPNRNLFDYITYIFRQMIHDLLQNEHLLFS